MKKFSDNIKVTSGKVLIQNLNLFMDENLDKRNKENLEEIKRRVAISLIKEHEIVEASDYCLNKTLAELSAPIIEENVIRNSFLIWNNRLFPVGYEFKFDENGVADVSDAEEVRVVFASHKNIDYDTYESEFEEIFNDSVIVEELELHDFMNYAERVKAGDESIEDNEEQETFKLLSLYYPTICKLNKEFNGRIFVYYITSLDENESTVMPINHANKLFIEADFERQKFDEKKRIYDSFLIEVVDASQPFAYITVEHMDFENYSQSENYIDTFKDFYMEDDDIVDIEYYKLKEQYCDEEDEELDGTEDADILLVDCDKDYQELSNAQKEVFWNYHNSLR